MADGSGEPNSSTVFLENLEALVALWKQRWEGDKDALSSFKELVLEVASLDGHAGGSKRNFNERTVTNWKNASHIPAGTEGVLVVSVVLAWTPPDRDPVDDQLLRQLWSSWIDINASGDGEKQRKALVRLRLALTSHDDGDVPDPLDKESKDLLDEFDRWFTALDNEPPPLRAYGNRRDLAPLGAGVEQAMRALRWALEEHDHEGGLPSIDEGALEPGDIEHLTEIDVENGIDNTPGTTEETVAAASADTGLNGSGSASSVTRKGDRTAILALVVGLVLLLLVVAIVKLRGSDDGSARPDTTVATSPTDVPPVSGQPDIANSSTGKGTVDPPIAGSGSTDGQTPQPVPVADPVDRATSLENAGDPAAAIDVLSGPLPADLDEREDRVVKAAELVGVDDPALAHRQITNAIKAGDVSGPDIEALALRYLYRVDPNEAVTRIEKLASDSTDGFVRLVHAEILVGQKKWKRAIDVAKQASATLDAAGAPDDQHSQALALSGTAALGVHKPKDAIADLEAARKLAALDPTFAFKLVEAYQVQGDSASLDKALELLDDLELQQPDTMRVLRARAYVFRQRKELPRARVAATQAVNLEDKTKDPVSASANHLALASVLMAEGDPDAEAEFQIAASLRPDGPAPLVGRAQLIFDQPNRSHEAVDLLIAATKLPTADASTFVSLCEWATFDSQFGVAEQACDTAIVLDDSWAEAEFRRGRIDALQIHPADAIKRYRQALDLDAGHLAARDNLCFELTWRSDERQQAVTECEVAQTYADVDPEVVLTLGSAYERVGRIGDADRMYRQSIDAKYQPADAYHRLANMYRSLPGADPAEIQDLMSKAYEGPTSNIGVLDDYASVLLQSHDADAVRLFDEATAVGGPSPERQLGRAFALFATDQAAATDAIHATIVADPIFVWSHGSSLGFPSPGLRREALDAAIAVKPADPDLNLALISTLYADSPDCLAAFDGVQQAVAKDPDHKRRYFQSLGECADRKNQTDWIEGLADSEIASGDKALGLYLRGYYVHATRAGAMTDATERRANYELAVTDLNAALTLDPDYYDAYPALSYVWRVDKDENTVDQVVALWSRAGSHWKDWTGWRTRMAADLMNLDRSLPGVQDAVATAIDALPNDPEAQQLKGRYLFFEQNNPEVAEPFLREAVADHAAAYEVYFAMGRRDSTNKWTMTEARLFAQAAAGLSADTDTLVQLGDRWFDLGEWLNAEAAYNDAVEVKHPANYVYPLKQLARLYVYGFEGGRQGDVMAVITKIEAALPDSVSDLDLIDWAQEVDPSTMASSAGPTLIGELLDLLGTTGSVAVSNSTGEHGAPSVPRVQALDLASEVMRGWPNEAGYRLALRILDIAETLT